MNKLYEKTLSPDAVQKLLEVKRHILEEPNRLAMGTMKGKIDSLGQFSDAFDGFYGNGPKVIVKPPCGTAGCILGWLCMLNRVPTPKIVEAVKILGVSWSQAEELYYTYNWPKDLQEAFKTPDLRKRAAATGEAIDRFIFKYAA